MSGVVFCAESDRRDSYIICNCRSVVYGNELKRYLRNMVYLRYVFGLIRGEIEYTCAPLPEIFFGVSARVKEPYRRWLKKTAEEMECRDLSGFARVWNRCTDKYLENTGIKTGA